MPLQIRRGSTDERLALTPLIGELVFDTTGSAVYIGDGVTPGGLPVTSFSTSDARNVTAQMFLGQSLADNSIHSGISFAVVNSRLTATVNVNFDTYDGTIRSSGFQGNYYADDSTLLINGATGQLQGRFKGDVIGSVFADDSTLLIDGTSGRIRAEVVQGTFTGNVAGDLTGNIVSGATNLVSSATGAVNLNGTVKDNVVPSDSEQYSVGTFLKKFSKIYLADSTSSIYVGNAALGSNGGTGIALPAGSTVGGVAIGTGGIVPGNNYYISVKDSSNVTIIDADASTVTASNLIGTVKGSVYDTTGSTLLVDGTGGFVPSAKVVTDAAQTAITSVGTLTALTVAGIVSSSGGFESYNTNPATKTALFSSSAASASAPSFNFRKSRGTAGAPTTVLSGDQVSIISFQGHDGTSYNTSAAIVAKITGTVGTGIVPGQLDFNVTNASGTLITPLAITSGGALTVTGNINTTANIVITQNTYSSTTPMIQMNQNHSTVDALNMNFNRGRGTSAAPVRVQAGDELADIGFNAYVAADDTASSGTNVQAATITAYASGSIGAGTVAGKLTLFLNNGTSNAERFTFDNDGVLAYTSTALSAGVGSGLVNTSGVATYMKVKLNGVYYAMPLYAINP